MGAAESEARKRAAEAAGRLLRVGECEVDVDRRVVSRPGAEEPRRLTLKALQVLLALVEAGGRVVSREQLLERVWPDTLPTDDVLTQAVAQLRRAFGGRGEAPPYIETIAKAGYRLVVPCCWIEPAATPEPAAVPAAPAPAVPAPIQPRPAPQEQAPAAAAGTGAPARAPRRRIASWWPALSLLLVLAFGAGAWQLLNPRTRANDAADVAAGAPPLQYQAIAATALPEQGPALSPDGSEVAYARPVRAGGPRTLYLQPAGDGSPRQLTFPGHGEADDLPAWSRDGRRIAFVRTGGDGCRLMVVAAAGGGEREVGRCEGEDYAAFDWSPDGRALVMGGRRRSSGQSAPLRRLDLGSGRWEALAYPADGLDTLPRFSPDGAWLGFRRGTSLGDLWLMPAAGGPPRQLTRLRGDIRGWDWLPDGSGLVFSLVKEEARLYRLALADGSITELPSPPRGNPVFPEVAADAWTMVFGIYRFRSGLYAFDLEAAGDGTQPGEPVFASSGVDLMPAVSPDGSTLAFVSDRSLAAQLWIGELEHPQTLRAVPGIVPVPRNPPVWAPDGSRLLVIGATGSGGDRLYQVEVGFDTVRVLPVPGVPAFAAWTGRPDQLLVGVDGSGGSTRLVLYQLPEWRELASLDDVALARYDYRQDRVCFSRTTRSGLWCADPALQRVVQVGMDAPVPEQYREWLVAGGRIFSTAPAPGCATGWSEIGAGAARPRCLSHTHAVASGSASVDEAGRHAFLALPLEDDMDVGLASLASLRRGAGR